MEFDIAQVDAVLTTTRAVRRRLDLDRAVPDELLLGCIDVAEQAPTGGALGSRRWVVVRDPATKKAIADLYREAGQGILQLAERMQGTGHPNEQVMASGAYLVEHLAQVPVLVLVTIWGEHDASGNPGLFDSVIQAAWSFCLALRARGLGSAWTTLHLAKKHEVAAVLGLPPGVSQIVLLPVAWTLGTDFGPAPRRPAREITYLDRWGHTSDRPSSDGMAHLADGPGVTLEIDIAAPPARVWELASDITVPSRFGTELQSAEWLDGQGPAVGSRFIGRNAMRQAGHWETVNHVVACDRPKVFAWHTGDLERPGAQWRFELEALGGSRTRLRFHVTIGPGFSGTSAMIEREPHREQEILSWRRHLLAKNMQRTLDGIQALAEQAG